GQDCNTNGTLDGLDISSGLSSDCNSNGTPDECESAALNGVLGFDGANDEVALPNGLISSRTVLTLELWFRTTGGGVLFGYQNTAYPAGPSNYVPALYVGTDGKLRGQFYNGVAAPIATAGTVNNGGWHHVALVGNVTTQSMYLDGALVNPTP